MKMNYQKGIYLIFAIFISVANAVYNDSTQGNVTGCGDVPDIAYGFITILENSTFGSEANVTCDTGYAAENINITCLTSGHWENATCIIIDCGDVPEVEHGNITLSENATFGSQANVSCDPGYTPDKYDITCLASGFWDNVTCIRTGCGDVPDIENGYIVLFDNSTFGSEANVTCDDGFYADRPNITCLTSGYWQNVTCSKLDCGDVPEIENGNIVLIDNSTVGSQANVTCDPFFTADKSNITCLTSGVWENVTCTNVTGCSDLPDLENGYLVFYNNLTYGSEGNVTCEPGFTSERLNTSCLSSGYSDIFICTRTGCGDVPYIENGYFELYGNTTFGSEANVTCDAGFTEDKSNITCLTTGYWENATCIMTGCGDVPDIAYGFITISENSTFGSEANVTCDTGYAAENINITCLTSGHWENATCIRIDCGNVTEIENGYITLSDNTTFGSEATVTCDDGFTAEQSNISCQISGYWDNVTCIRTGCGDVPYIENGHFELYGNTTFGSEANVTCDAGFTEDKSNITCLTTGYWENATCIMTGCGVPDIAYGFITILGNATFGSEANVTCDTGYAAENINITCLTSGHWENATCIRIDCGNVTEIENGYITLSDNTTFGSEATVTCDDGFTAEQSNISCQISGYWDNVTCTRTGCGEVPFIENGYFELYGNTTFGSAANVTCDAGFTEDKSNITCLTTGYWENAICIMTGCGDVPEIADGNIFAFENSTFGSEANVTCDTGFFPDKSNISCLTSGYWENVTCIRKDCGDVPDIDNGNITLANGSAYGSEADVTCVPGYSPDNSVISCLSSGNWNNVTCLRTGCDHVPEIDDGIIVPFGDAIFGSEAEVLCNPGFAAEQANITCLTSGYWDNVTCIRTECDINDLPSIENGEVETNGNQTTASVANVSCNQGYAATSPVVACQGQGHWQDDVFCVSYDLGSVAVETGQTIINGQHTAYFKCAFTVVDGLKYRIKWFVNGIEFHDTEVIDSSQASVFVLTDDMFTNSVTSFSAFFTLQVKCSAVVYDGAGESELENGTSAEMTPLHVSTNSITMMRGKEATFTVFLNFPFGCSADGQDCFLRIILYDPNDSYNCYDSTIAMIHSDTCGGKIEGATPATINQLSTTGTYTNITITTKNNRWYRLRSQFSLVLKLTAVGNSKTFWNSPSTSLSVTVTENILTKYRGCYSFVDPYIYTFDRRWYSNQLLEEFVLFRHKSLPIEVQTITAPCNRWATCSCAVTVRAGGDVFTINHCSGHLSTYLSANDGILKVYRLWSTYYQIVLPTGMNVYVYVMSYFNYMMNVYVTPTPSDFEQMEGLCGNFNGDFSDDTLLRGTTQSDPVESSYGYWWWWSEYFFPLTFAYSWGLVRTGRQDESLLNPDVYENVESWDSNKKLCVCPYAHTGSDYNAMCSADEEATCTRPVWRWGTRIVAQSRTKRDVDGCRRFSRQFKTDVKKRLKRMKDKWETLRALHSALRKKREVTTTISIEEAERMCAEQLNSNCNTYSKKDDVSDVAESNDTLENCARDTAISGTTEWVTPHCDAITQKVTVEIEKDVEFAENNTELVDNIVENSCPSNCSGNGQCVNQTCVCFQDFGTDLCLLNLTLGPLIEELADEGICDVSSGNECDYILIVGNGFVETAKCNLTVYVAGTDGNFNMTEEFEINCTYATFNELYANVPEITNSSEDTNTTLIARMYEITVSNDGINFGSREKVVVLDTTCQQHHTNADNETIVTLKSGYCYIAATCYKAGTLLSGSSCAKCDTSQNVFVWTDGCDNEDDTNKNYLIIIGSSVGGAILVGAVVLSVFIYKYKKAKSIRTLEPIVEMSLGPSKMKFWYRKDSNVAIVEHHTGPGSGKKQSAAEYSDDDGFPGRTKGLASNW